MIDVEVLRKRMTRDMAIIHNSLRLFTAGDEALRSLAMDVGELLSRVEVAENP